MREQRHVIFNAAAAEAAVNDPPAQRMQVGFQELLQLFAEEIGELLRALIVCLRPDFLLAVHLEQDGGDGLTLQKRAPPRRARYSRVIHCGMKPTSQAPMCWFGIST
jgi:hypothetical protein